MSVTKPRGVTIKATAHYLPERVVTNADLEKMMDTSDEWIVQRTGVRERHFCAEGESTREMSFAVLKDLLRNANIRPDELDLFILATVGSHMACPSTACQILGDLAGDPEFGPTNAGAFDITVACSGFTYGLNMAHDLMASGQYRNIAVVGAEHLSKLIELTTVGRGTAIIFGDGAGGAVVSRSDNPEHGIVSQMMRSDGSKWHELYIPREERDIPEVTHNAELPIGLMRMNGRAIFKFAVGTFGDLIQETLDKADLAPSDVDHYICHQSNIRILDACRERFGIPEEKLPTNIHRLGNTSAASVPILFDEQVKAGRIKPGQKVMFVAFGAGLTWTSSLWQL
jgi:3-oxoacyl-[acyl-carrier-protein] synthase-3